MGTNQRSQITMSDDEIAEFIEQQPHRDDGDGRARTARRTSWPCGTPCIDGQIWFETKAKAQKTRQPAARHRITCMIEDGLTYDTLRGVSIEGTGEIVEDPDAIWKVGVNVWERYNGPYTEEMKPLVEIMLNKRVVVRVDADRVRSWDHRKLGMDPMPIAGTTAAYLPGAPTT